MTLPRPEAGMLEEMLRKALEVMPTGTFLIDQERKIVWTHPESQLTALDWPPDVALTLGELLTPEPSKAANPTRLTAACLQDWELYLIRGAAGRNFVVCGNSSCLTTPRPVSAPTAPSPSPRDTRSSTADSS